MRTKHFAIMLTDIKGFTSRTASSSRAEMMGHLNKHKEIVMPVVDSFSGNLVKTIGDAFLVTFESPTDAVLCGISIQDKLKEYNESKESDERIEIRIAINSGEVSVEEDGDIYGDAVNITSRLESIAEAGEVFFTEAVYLAMNKKEVPSSEIGYRQFKGIPEKIKVFRVLKEVPIGEQPSGIMAEDTLEPEKKINLSKVAFISAGFWRRFASLLLDVLFLVIIGSSLGLVSCGDNAKVSSKENYVPKDMTIENVKISRAKKTAKIKKAFKAKVKALRNQQLARLKRFIKESESITF